MKPKNIPFLFKIEKSLGPLEFEVMKFIWGKKKLTVREALINFKKQRKIAYTTLMTVMNNLYRKGFLTRKKIKKTYFYQKSAEEKIFIDQSISNTLNTLSTRYGKKKITLLFFPVILFSVFHFKIDFPKFWFVYRTPVSYGFSLTFLLAALAFSFLIFLHDLSVLGTLEYLGLIASEPSILISRFNLVFFAFWESLPIGNFLISGLFFVLVVFLAKKLAGLLEFKIPTLEIGGTHK